MTAHQTTPRTPCEREAPWTLAHGQARPAFFTWKGTSVIQVCRLSLLYNSDGSNSLPRRKTEAYSRIFTSFGLRKAAVVGRRRITLHGTSSSKKISGDLSKVRVAQKGHFAVYATDGARFEIPVSYLGDEVIGKLLAMAEEEFGIQSKGPTIFPLDASSMRLLISSIGRGSAPEPEKASMVSLARCSSHLTADMMPVYPQIYVCS